MIEIFQLEDFSTLQLIWFGLLGVLLTGYAILDGFDLGVGALHMLAKSDHERRIFMNSIGPVWDGNEVWLLTFGGALFAAFPDAYATAFSGFYIPLMLVLLCLILRATSMELRSKHDDPRWRQAFDWLFSISSIVVSVLFGVAVGNVMLGVPVNEYWVYTGGFFNLLNPGSLVTGLFALSMVVMQGSIYLWMKTEGELQDRVRGWIMKAFYFYLTMFVVTTVIFLTQVETTLINLKSFPIAWLVILFYGLAIANIPRCVVKNLPGQAFFTSCCVIAAMVFLFGIEIFPNLIVSSTNPEYSLNIVNAASSERTLQNMLVIAVLGMPVVLAYTISIYYVFRGKVKLDKFSY